MYSEIEERTRREILFFFEVYTKNPLTGEGGWDITVGTIDGVTTRLEARKYIEEFIGPLFDEFIQCYEVTKDARRPKAKGWTHLTVTDKYVHPYQ